MQLLDVGETVPIVTAWFDDDGAAVDPTAIALTITKPGGIEIDKTMSDQVGSESTTGSGSNDVWTYRLVVPDNGLWRVRATATIGSEAVTPQSFMFLVGDGARPGASPVQPWCSWEDVEATCPSVDLSGLSPEARGRLLDLATDILWSLDGRRYPGIGEATRRVCRSCSSCVTSPCCCSARSSIDLGTRWPVYGVWDVVVDGETLDPSAYQLRDRRFVDRIDGESWPRCASMADPDAFMFSWAFGRKPPLMLVNACAVFVAEMAKSCVGVSCELPSRVTNITREGVNYTILDSQKFLDDGKVGIYTVDLALIAAKAGRKPRPGGSSPLHGQRTSRIG